MKWKEYTQLFITIIILLISTFAFSQKRIIAEFILQPGTSFVSGDWKNSAAFGAPSFRKKITPTFETGGRMIFILKGKRGSQVVYDEMYGTNSYLAEKVNFSIGLLYSFCGQKYKDMAQAGFIWSRKLALQYVKIPLKIELVKGNEGDNQLIYSGGFYVGFLSRFKETNSVKTSKDDVITVAKGSGMTATSSNGDVTQYSLQQSPYQSLDYGFSLGAGVQKLLAPGLFLQFILNGQFGLTNILNPSAQYSDGVNLHPYFGTTPSKDVAHKNSSISLMIGLKKRFEWTSGPAKEHKKWRLFRLKE